MLVLSARQNNVDKMAWRLKIYIYVMLPGSPPLRSRLILSSRLPIAVHLASPPGCFHCRCACSSVVKDSDEDTCIRKHFFYEIREAMSYLLMQSTCRNQIKRMEGMLTICAGSSTGVCTGATPAWSLRCWTSAFMMTGLPPYNL